MHNSFYHNYATSQHHKDKLYERFEKEQDSVNFIKTLLKLKHKTPSTLATSSNTIQPYSTPKPLSNDNNKPQTLQAITTNDNILHKRRSSHRVEQGMLFKSNIKLNTVYDSHHLKLKQQSMLSRNNNNNVESNKESLSNVSQGKIKGAVNKFKQSIANKDKECYKKISLLNVKKFSNNNNSNNNKCVLKTKKNDNSIKKINNNNKVIVVNRISNSTNKKCYCSNTVTKNKLLLSKQQQQQQRKHIPITVINLFGNEDNNNNNNKSYTTSTTKTELTSTTNHIRNLSDRIQIEKDFLKPTNNNK